jgi:hypothetical protein
MLFLAHVQLKNLRVDEIIQLDVAPTAPEPAASPSPQAGGHVT